MTFFISIIKCIFGIIGACVIVAVLYLFIVIVREAGWIIQQENRKQYKEKQGKDNEKNKS